MMVIRPVEPGDLPGLLKLAAETGGGLTSLPVPAVVGMAMKYAFSPMRGKV